MGWSSYDVKMLIWLQWRSVLNEIINSLIAYFILLRISRATEDLFKTLPLQANATIRQSGKHIGAVVTCSSEITDQLARALFVDGKIDVRVDKVLGKETNILDPYLRRTF